ncbi:MAG: sigma-70 family RNA polymerase sigma factor [Phycisphaerales bacterium]
MSRNMMAGSPLEQVQRRTGVVVPSGATPTTRKARARVARKSLSAHDQRELKRILREPMDFIDSDAFYEDDAEVQIYDEAPPIQQPDTSWYHPVMDSLTASTKAPKQSTQVLLTAAEERVLFLQFNYARYRVWRKQEELNGREPSHEDALELLSWNRVAERLREQIANTNLALVLAMAKRTRMSEVDFADLVSEGNMALLRAVDKFDCGRGFKFSTYACRAILKAFSRQGMKLSKYRQRFPADFDPKLERSDYMEKKRASHEEECADEVKTIVLENRANLTSIEQTVINHRFGIAVDNHTPLTLEQVGQIIGVTKERVRQIQNKALEKIRQELEENFLERQAAEEEAAREAELVGAR